MRMPVSAALIAWAVLDFTALSGSALAELAGPANLPPGGYDGLQFVDARGCLFLRAGYGVQTVWVPMVDEGKKQICSMAPSFAGAAAAPAPFAAPPAAPPPAAKPAAAAAPVVVASAPAAASATRPAAAGARDYQMAALGAATAACAARAPVLERVLLRNGGTALVCTQGDGTLTGWNPPVFAEGAGVGAALGYAPATPQTMRGARLAGTVAAQAAPKAAAAPVASAAAVIPPPPKGWKLAWKDGRLNPMRGVGTAEGQAQMDARWTREVPANLVTEPAKPFVFARPLVLAAPVSTPVTAAPVARMSTMSAPAPKQTAASAGAIYVQIGSFAVAANAAGAAAQIAALGLPAASGQPTRGGNALQVVFAGPFTDTGAAHLALAVLRSAGFKDAFIR